MNCRHMSALRHGWVLVCVGMLGACGEDGTNGRSVVSVSAVAVTCERATMAVGETNPCSAIVAGTGAFDDRVIWSADGGAIDQDGLFQAPGVSNTVQISATSLADANVIGITTVTVTDTVRRTADQPDDDDGYQVHVLYVVPSDGTDRMLDLDGTLRRSVASFNKWFAARANAFRVRMDTFQGALDITFVRLDRSEQQFADYGSGLNKQLEYELIAKGFDDTRKIYLTYYGGTAMNSSCGNASLPPLQPGTIAAIYPNGVLENAQDCDTNRFTSDVDTPGFLEFVAVHEIGHQLGLVPACAPNETLRGHISDDPTDLMYAGDLPWQPDQIDVNGDDYYQAGVPGCLDLSRSSFLDPLPLDAAPQPGWPYDNLVARPCDLEASLASPATGADSSIGFANATDNAIQIHALDDAGQRVRVPGELGAKEGGELPTRAGDHWVVTDTTDQCLAIFTATDTLGRAVTR